MAGSWELALLAGILAHKTVQLRFGYVHGDQLCTLAHLPAGAVSFCLCFQASEATDLNTFLHEIFSLHRIFTGGFKSFKQGHN